MSTWRVGRKLGRTVYRDDVLVGIMDTAEDAALVVAAAERAEAAAGQMRAALELARVPARDAACDEDGHHPGCARCRVIDAIHEARVIDAIHEALATDAGRGWVSPEQHAAVVTQLAVSANRVAALGGSQAAQAATGPAETPCLDQRCADALRCFLTAARDYGQDVQLREAARSAITVLDTGSK